MTVGGLGHNSVLLCCTATGRRTSTAPADEQLQPKLAAITAAVELRSDISIPLSEGTLKPLELLAALPPVPHEFDFPLSTPH